MSEQISSYERTERINAVRDKCVKAIVGTIKEQIMEKFIFWDAGVECAKAGGRLTDNPVQTECYGWREWRRGFIHEFRKINGRFP